MIRGILVVCLYGNQERYFRMAYAIVETSGTQLRVEPGRFYDVNRLPVEEDGSITLDKVLYVENEGEVTIGQPFIEGATVEATIERHLRGRKVIVYKMKPKKKTRKKRGHRQELTRMMITGINLNGTVISADLSSADDLDMGTLVAADELTAEEVGLEPTADVVVAEEVVDISSEEVVEDEATESTDSEED